MRRRGTHGLRQREDAIETLWRGYTYLRLRAQLEDSGDYATTAEQTIVGLSFELSRRGAKAWDPEVARGLKGSARRKELLRRRGSALTKLLNELAEQLDALRARCFSLDEWCEFARRHPQRVFMLGGEYAFIAVTTPEWCER